MYSSLLLSPIPLRSAPCDRSLASMSPRVTRSRSVHRFTHSFSPRYTRKRHIIARISPSFSPLWLLLSSLFFILFYPSVNCNIFLRSLDTPIVDSIGYVRARLREISSSGISVRNEREEEKERKSRVTECGPKWRKI